MRTPTSLLSFLVLALCWTTPAQAQSERGAEPPPSAASALPLVGSDLVRLSNGGLLRGTITELLPGRHVVIVTGSGEAHRFSAEEVEYAGPADGAPSAAAPRSSAPTPATPQPTDGPLEGDTQSADEASSPSPADAPAAPPAARADADAPSGSPVRFHFVGAQPELTLHLVEEHQRAASQSSGPGLERTFAALCTAPCEPQIAPGPHAFAVSAGAGHPTPHRGLLELENGQTLEARYVSNARARKLGWALFGGFVAVGLAVASIPLIVDADSEGQALPPLLGGAALMAVGGGCLAFLGTRPDEAQLTLRE